MKNVKRSKWLYMAAWGVGVMLLVEFGCSSTGEFYGIQRSLQTSRQFEAYKVMPRYNYYYYGTKDYPWVILALKKDLTLDSTLWKPIDLTPERLKRWMVRADNRGAISMSVYGYKILDRKGQTAGEYYLLRDDSEALYVQVGADNHVRVGSPTLQRRFPPLWMDD